MFCSQIPPHNAIRDEFGTSLSINFGKADYEKETGDLRENRQTERNYLSNWDPTLKSSKLSDNQKKYLKGNGNKYFCSTNLKESRDSLQNYFDY